MIVGISLLVIGFAWLLIETRCLTIRLPVGPNPNRVKLLAAGKPILMLPAHKPIDMTVPYWWMTGAEKETGLLVCQSHWSCAYRDKCKKTERWTGWKLPARKFAAFGMTFDLASGCNIARAMLLSEVVKAQKSRKSSIVQYGLPLHPIIEQVRVGSHTEFHATDDKGHGWHQTVCDYETVYRDSLVPRGWLMAHEHDLDNYEPTIEISVDGQPPFSVDGNYKKGIIQGFMADFVVKPKRKSRKPRDIEDAEVTVNAT